MRLLCPGSNLQRLTRYCHSASRKSLSSVSENLDSVDEKQQELYNTNSIHMWCVAVAVSPGQSGFKRLWAAGVSLFVVAVQILMLNILILDSLHPSCGAHTDCAEGTFCNPFGGLRCTDCHMVQSNWRLNTTFCDRYRDDLDFPYDDIDQTVTHLADPLRWHDNTFHSEFVNSTLKKELCLALIHCAETDIYPLECDHIMLKLGRVHWSAMLLLVFMSLLMSLPLILDMDEATVEEALLDHELRNGVTSVSVILAAQLVRASLRIRCTMLPILTAMAAVAVTVASEFSSTDFVLNLLTVAFISEVDDMVSLIFLRSEAHHLADTLIEEVVSPVSLPWLETRITALGCSCLVAVISLSSPSFIQVYGEWDAWFFGRPPPSANGCESMAWMLVRVALETPLVFSFIVQPLHTLVRSSNHRVRKTINRVWRASIGYTIYSCMGFWVFASVFPQQDLFTNFARMSMIVAVTFMIVDVIVRTKCCNVATLCNTSKAGITGTTTGASTSVISSTAAADTHAPEEASPSMDTNNIADVSLEEDSVLRQTSSVAHQTSLPFRPPPVRTLTLTSPLQWAPQRARRKSSAGGQAQVLHDIAASCDKGEDVTLLTSQVMRLVEADEVTREELTALKVQVAQLTTEGEAARAEVAALKEAHAKDMADLMAAYA